MKILVVSATFLEVEIVLNKYSISKLEVGEVFSVNENKLQIDFLITGVGMVNTTYYLALALLKQKYDVCINAGVAGSFNEQIRIGDVVHVIADRFVELGAEDGDGFITLDEMGLGTQNVSPTKNANNNYNLISELRAVNGITVNKVHGNEMNISKIKLQFNPDVESMEGAAFMFVCEKEKVNYFQVRAISNVVERRNRNNWNLPLAKTNINNFLISFLNSLA